MNMTTTVEKSQSLSSNKTDIKDPKNYTLTLLPENYENSIYNDNLVYFKIAHPTIYNAVVSHVSKEYRLCSNPDGSPNIIDMKNGTPLYYAFSMQDINKLIDLNINSMTSSAAVSDIFLGGTDEVWKKNNPIQYGMVNQLYKAGMFNELNMSNAHLEPLQNFSSDYMPYVRVSGIGLGYHITGLIKSKKINYMTIFEPHLDLFYTSLFVVPWQLMFRYFDDSKGKSLNLIIGGDADAAIRSNVSFLRQRLLPLTSFYYRCNHLTSEQSQELLSKEPQSDAVERQQSDAGWYEDQRFGFYLSARNIKKENKVFTGKKTSKFFRAFIVGSGPSLNESLEYIKQHHYDAVVISCGSAITPLLNAGIVPDYEVVQERVWHFEEHEEKHDLDLLKKITLLKLNVVSPKIDHFYKDTLVFQKFRDPGSSLLGKEYAITTGVNPTVTNSGIAMCGALGVDEVYLFGVDYGAPRGSKKMHADNTIYDDESIDDGVEAKTNFDLPGNLGTPIKTDTVLSWSHQTTELKIAEYPKIKWINVGEGALIKGAIPMHSKDLPERFSKKIQKKFLLDEIASCFNCNYDSEAILQALKTTQLQQIRDYFNALLGFTESKPQTQEEITHVLSLMYNAVNTGKEQTNYLPASLLLYGFIQFINNVYIQSSIAPNDERASHFFQESMTILKEYISNIDNDILRILSFLDLDNEIDLVEKWKKFDQ